MAIVLSILFIILGYIIGKITCNSHFKKSGFWITIFVFIIINGLHSLIDGISLTGITPFKALGLMIGHEALRQPILYALFLAMIAPFTLSRWKRYAAAFGAVTLVWLIAALIGTEFGQLLSGFTAFDTIVPYLQFLYIGDIIHHLVDYFFHKHNTS